MLTDLVQGENLMNVIKQSVIAIAIASVFTTGAAIAGGNHHHGAHHGHKSVVKVVKKTVIKPAPRVKVVKKVVKKVIKHKRTKRVRKFHRNHKHGFKRSYGKHPRPTHHGKRRY